MTQAAPTGPIRLFGWSFGGSLALLIAQGLTERGRETEFDPEAVLAGLLREMGFPVDPGATMSVAEAVALVADSGDALAVLDDAHIAQAIENYVAAERFHRPRGLRPV